MGYRLGAQLILNCRQLDNQIEQLELFIRGAQKGDAKGKASITIVAEKDDPAQLTISDCASQPQHFVSFLTPVLTTPQNYVLRVKAQTRSDIDQFGPKISAMMSTHVRLGSIRDKGLPF
jgi:hypothetical protein